MKSENGQGIGAMEELFEEALPREKQLALVEALVDRAMGGDVRVAEYLFDRIYGRPALAARRTVADEVEMTTMDLSVLDESEVLMLDHLLKKCNAQVT